jgi:predicted membrane protein
LILAKIDMIIALKSEQLVSMLGLERLGVLGDLLGVAGMWAVLGDRDGLYQGLFKLWLVFFTLVGCLLNWVSICCCFYQGLQGVCC